MGNQETQRSSSQPSPQQAGGRPDQDNSTPQQIGSPKPSTQRDADQDTNRQADEEE